jgi:hypothetical protein
MAGPDQMPKVEADILQVACAITQKTDSSFWLRQIVAVN